MLANRLTKVILRNKQYAHLDAKRKPDAVEHLVKKSKWVESHGFLPFIHVVLKVKKRKGKRKPPEWKERHIYYSSHMDRYIYQWYAHLTSGLYEDYILSHGFQDAPIAYRQNLGGKNNVNFAKEAFEFIRSQPSCFVYITDFKSFFDTLSHRILKEKLKKVHGVRELPRDHYQVFKTMTKFRYFDLEDIATVTGTSVKELRGRNTKPEQLLKQERMRHLKKTYLKSNPNGPPTGEIGIPQGSPISAVYANVYMIDFDQQMMEYVRSVGGYYRRYSDDLICIVPLAEAQTVQDIIQKKVRDFEVTISENKTKIFDFYDGRPHQKKKAEAQVVRMASSIEYLGLAFDGQTIRLKDGTLNKYYQKLDRRLHLMRVKSAEFKKVIGRKRTYLRFSHLGEANRQHLKGLRGGIEPPMKKRNFFSYAYDASIIVNDPEIRKQLKGHSKHIRRFYESISADLSRC